MCLNIILVGFAPIARAASTYAIPLTDKETDLIILVAFGTLEIAIAIITEVSPAPIDANTRSANITVGNAINMSKFFD